MRAVPPHRPPQNRPQSPRQALMRVPLNRLLPMEVSAPMPVLGSHQKADVAVRMRRLGRSACSFSSPCSCDAAKLRQLPESEESHLRPARSAASLQS